MAGFKQTLESLGLGDYEEIFVSEGFDTWETLADVTESDLNELGVKLGHRRKLQRAIAESRKPLVAGALPQPISPPALEPDGLRRANSDASLPDGRFSDSQTSTGRRKRKYRRHPKPDLNAPERPASAYVLFSNHMREELKDRELSFTEMAKIVGEKWQLLPTEEREHYEQHASAAKEKYQAGMAEYKKTEQYAQYQEYLSMFRAKNEPGKTTGGDVGKVPRMSHETSTETQSSNDMSNWSNTSPYTMSAPSPVTSQYFTQSSVQLPSSTSLTRSSNSNYFPPPAVRPTTQRPPSPLSSPTKPPPPKSAPSIHHHPRVPAHHSESILHAPVSLNENDRSHSTGSESDSFAARVPNAGHSDSRSHRILPTPVPSNSVSAPAALESRPPLAGSKREQGGKATHRSGTGSLEALLRAGELVAARDADASGGAS